MIAYEDMGVVKNIRETTKIGMLKWIEYYLEAKLKTPTIIFEKEENNILIKNYKERALKEVRQKIEQISKGEQLSLDL